MSEIANIIAELTPEQRALLELRLKKKRANSSPIKKISTRPDPNSLPLSPGQERLWVLHQLAPESAIHNFTQAVRLQGALNIDILAQSLGQIMERHQILRTSFADVRGQPVQSIAPVKPVNLAVIDLQGFSETKREEEAQRLMNEEAQRPFNLSQGSLLRTGLLRLGPEDYVLLVTMHHIISDAWSFGLFWRELSNLYPVLLAGSSYRLPDLPIQYADYAYWHQQWLQSKEAEAQLAYWQHQLAGQVPALRLPTDRLPSSIQTLQGGVQSLILPQTLSQDLTRLSRQAGVTLFVTMLAAFKTLLYQYSGQEDLVVCSPIAGRRQVELQNLIGYFNNIVALRSDLSANPTFGELLDRVQQVVLAADEHQELPFQDVAALSNLVRTPLSRALFVLNDAVGALELPGIQVSIQDVDSGVADFDIALHIKETGQKLTVALRYKTDLFSAPLINHLLNHFQQLLESVVGDPGQQLAALPGLTESELASITENRLRTSNDSEEAGNAVTSRAEPEQHAISVRDNLEFHLTKIWEQVLGIQPIGIRDNFFELGGHSLLAVRLFSQIEQQLVGQKLPLAMLLQAPTIEQLAQALRDEGWSSVWSSLVPIQPKGSTPPLFFIHAHGGNVLGYRKLAHYLGPEQPFYGLQAQGLDGQEVGPRRFDEMAAHYIKEIRTVQPEGPYFLGGFCLGGLVAYEMAQQLQEEDEETAVLAMISSDHPDYPIYLPGTDSFRRWIYRIIWNVDAEMTNFFYGDARARWDQIKRITRRHTRRLGTKAETTIRAILAKCRVTIPHSQASKLEQLGDANNMAYENYEPRPYRGSVTLFRPEKEPLGIYPDPTLGWGECIQGQLEILEFPGHHIDVLKEPRVQIVAKQLREVIDRVLEGE